MRFMVSAATWARREINEYKKTPIQPSLQNRDKKLVRNEGRDESFYKLRGTTLVYRLLTQTDLYQFSDSR